MIVRHLDAVDVMMVWSLRERPTNLHQIELDARTHNAQAKRNADWFTLYLTYFKLKQTDRLIQIVSNTHTHTYRNASTDENRT